MSSNPTITAFANSPDKGQGLARDMTVRWALEEVGQTYDVDLVPFEARKESANRVRHPFGKIPTYRQNDLTLFESGAIVLHIAETHRGLLPEDKNARARAIMWMFAAFSTMEPPIMELSLSFILERGKTWFPERHPMLQDRVHERLSELSNYLGDKEWLEGGFSAGDLVMIAVMRRLKSSGLLNEYPNIAAYIARGESRPAFKRAFAAQLAVAQASQQK